MDQFDKDPLKKSLPSRKGIKINRRKIGQEKSQQLEEQYEPQIYQAQKMGVLLSGKLIKGTWTLQENKIYIKYLTGHMKTLMSNMESNKKKVFKQLSQLLKKRTANQCKSHHNKLLLRHGSIDNIISYVSKKIERNQQVSKYYQKSTKLLQIRSGNTKIGTQNLEKNQNQELIIDINEIVFW